MTIEHIVEVLIDDWKDTHDEYCIIWAHDDGWQVILKSPINDLTLNVPYDTPQPLQGIHMQYVLGIVTTRNDTGRVAVLTHTTGKDARMVTIQ